jgi:hypothetical protein
LITSRPASPRSLVALAMTGFVLACGSSGSNGAPGGSKGPLELAGIGDSIMQAVDAEPGLPFGDQVELSFARGSDGRVDSLFSRYQALGYLVGRSGFVSQSGAEMVGAGSIPNALGQAQSICNRSTKPDRIALMLGGNDICNRSSFAALYPVQSFRDALKSALDTLGQPSCGLPAGARVHVLSMPRVDLLRAAGLQQGTGYGGNSCQTIWSFGSICTVVTGETQQSVLDQIGATIDAYNDGIRAEVEAADALYGGTGIRFTTDWQGPMPAHANTSVGTVTFGASDLSDVDCFHPSVSGQGRLACIAWESWEPETPNVAGCF